MKSLRVEKVEKGYYYKEKGVYVCMRYRGTYLEFFYSFDKKNKALTLVNAYDVPEIPRDRWVKICRQAAAIGEQHRPPEDPRPVQQKLFR